MNLTKLDSKFTFLIMLDISETSRDYDRFTGVNQKGFSDDPYRRVQAIAFRFGHEFAEALVMVLGDEGGFRADENQQFLKKMVWHGQNSKNELNAAKLTLQQDDIHAAATAFLTLKESQK